MPASFCRTSCATSAPLYSTRIPGSRMSAPSQTVVPSLRGRIGGDARSGHYPVPHRYRLHLTPSCPQSLRIAVTHGLLGLGEILPVTLLPAVPDGPEGEYAALRPLYEA